METTTRSDTDMTPSDAGGGLGTGATMTALRPTDRARDANGAVGVRAIPASAVAAPGATPVKPLKEYPRYRVSVAEYVTFHRQGFLIVRGLVPPEDVQELVQHSEDLMYGRVAAPGIEPPPPGATPEEIERRYLRIHMLHRVLEIHERFLLHPRVLDVLEALIGPDVMAMQSMFFLKFPGGAGQGYHQDAYYIPTVPDTLCGAWLAVDRADEENGCMWFTPGTQDEPIYPTAGLERQNHGDALADLAVVRQVSNTDEEANTLSRIAATYPGAEIPAVMEPGDVAFFGGHVLHRSKANWSADRFRRAFVGHYCNARAWTQWGVDTRNPDGADPLTGMTNGSHILARGDTHLPFARPRFGTPCAALLTPDERRIQGKFAATMMADMDSGLMGASPADPTQDDDD